MNTKFSLSVLKLLKTKLFCFLQFFCKMNDTECLPTFYNPSKNASNDDYKVTLISVGTIVGVTVIVCVIAVILIVTMRLHTKMVYRLALYQIVSIILLLVLWEAYLTARLSVSGLGGYVVGTVLTFSAYVYQSLCTWIVVHLFALAVCHKNLNRLEPLYVVSSLLVSSVMLVVSLILVFVAKGETNSDGCITYHVILIKRIVEGIVACLVIAFNCASMIVTGLILCRRAYGKHIAGYRSLSQQHKKALCEMLPLLMFPVLSIVTPVLYIELNHFNHAFDYRSRFVISFITFTWSMMCILSIISHLGVVLYIRRTARASINRRNIAVHEGSHILATSNA